MWQQLVDLIIRLFPRISIVPPNERGVFLRGGRYRKSVGPGWYFCWPYIDEVQRLDVTPQVINLPNQSIMTKQGRPLAVSGAIEYSIQDVKKALLEVQNFDTSLQNLAMGIISTYISDIEGDAIDKAKLELEVVRKVRIRAKDWGLRITKFWITDLVEHKCFRIMTHDSPLASVGLDTAIMSEMR